MIYGCTNTQSLEEHLFISVKEKITISLVDWETERYERWRLTNIFSPLWRRKYSKKTLESQEKTMGIPCVHLPKRIPIRPSRFMLEWKEPLWDYIPIGDFTVPGNLQSRKEVKPCMKESSFLWMVQAREKSSFPMFTRWQPDSERRYCWLA